MTTSAVGRLVPQYPLQICGPGFLHLHARSLQRVCVLTFPPAEPDLKTETARARVLGHPDVVRLENTTTDTGRHIRRKIFGSLWGRENDNPFHEPNLIDWAHELTKIADMWNEIKTMKSNLK